jgi:hypothetical protein
VKQVTTSLPSHEMPLDCQSFGQKLDRSGRCFLPWRLDREKVGCFLQLKIWWSKHVMGHVEPMPTSGYLTLIPLSDSRLKPRNTTVLVLLVVRASQQTDRQPCNTTVLVLLVVPASQQTDRQTAAQHNGAGPAGGARLQTDRQTDSLPKLEPPLCVGGHMPDRQTDVHAAQQQAARAFKRRCPPPPPDGVTGLAEQNALQWDPLYGRQMS